ncbi:MAG: hypothetical protein GXP55_12180 [Deltaproteobacteria bacterium]|nr:hypothetical protein [Deltaproteobacteria bacterium]
MRFEMRLTALMLTACCACGATEESAPAPTADSPAPAADSPTPVAPPEQVRPLTTEVWSMPMPPNTREVNRESIRGTDGSSARGVLLTTETEVSAAIAHFAGLADMGEVYEQATKRCVDAADGTHVCVAPASEIPSTLATPTQPAMATAPSGTRAWITLHRSTDARAPRN